MESKSEIKQGHCESVLCMYGSSLLCRDVCLMPRTKFGSNIILNILATDVLYHVYILKWKQKGKYRIETLRT